MFDDFKSTNTPTKGIAEGLEDEPQIDNGVQGAGFEDQKIKDPKELPVPHQNGSTTGAPLNRQWRIWTAEFLKEIKTEFSPDEQKVEFMQDFIQAWLTTDGDAGKAMELVVPGLDPHEASSRGQGLIRMISKSQSFQELRKLMIPNEVIVKRMNKIVNESYDDAVAVKAAKFLVESGLVQQSNAPRVTINVLGQLKSSIQQLPDEMIDVTSRVSSKNENVIDIEVLLSDKPASE